MDYTLQAASRGGSIGGGHKGHFRRHVTLQIQATTKNIYSLIFSAHA